MIMSANIFKIIIFLALAHGSNGGCDVNDWPHSCLANFRIGKQRCEPCESGRYGCNCSQNCPVNTYGPGCYTSCDCPVDEFCDPMAGCMNITTTTHSIREETTRQVPDDPANNISSSPQNNIDVKTYTTTTLKNEIYGLSSLKIVGISIATSVPMVVLSILVSILFNRRKVDRVTLDKDLDAKSINAGVSETDDQNNDTLLISQSVTGQTDCMQLFTMTKQRTEKVVLLYHYAVLQNTLAVIVTIVNHLKVI